MRLQRRNTTVFQYRANTGAETETITADGRHTGLYEPVYAQAQDMRGSISAPTGYAAENLFGISTPYTHVLVMDTPNPGIAEDGLIDWNGNTYEIKAVKPSLNSVSIALKQMVKNHAPAPQMPQEPAQGGTEPAGDGD